ncbi:hypothetical protein [Desulfonatronum thioautotrophicum]|uniref:hypothetical protein n=1 Tax=Desulfonatronum thioautotrophicum TaxID=617001 RepID=UPI0005EB5EBD|nr:hypothetical protein [Desulfonatronum thioautotrophicum]
MARLIYQMLLFNPDWYLENNPDVRIALDQGRISSAYEHYITWGARELRQPNELFDPWYYMSFNPDVRAAIENGDFEGNPFNHFVANGLQEGRKPSMFYHDFDEAAYLSKYADVKNAVDAGYIPNGFFHFVMWGAEENRTATVDAKPGMIFTLVDNTSSMSQESVLEEFSEIYPELVTMWGYTPCTDCDTGYNGVPLEQLLTNIDVIAGYDFFAEISGNIREGDTIPNLSQVEELHIGGVSGDGTAQVVVTLIDGSKSIAQVDLTQVQADLINDLLFDDNGNSRLFQQEMYVKYDDEGNPTYYAKLPTETTTVVVTVPIELTTNTNNGFTHESGFTGAGDDLIQVGRLELLHQAYIDAGPGDNRIEIDAKGTYAQPRSIQNVQEIHVQNLPNVYTDQSGRSTYPDLADYPGSGADETITKSAIDLSRAIDLEHLTIAEGYSFGHVPLGDLTVAGIRGNATTELQGGFSQSVILHYGAGITGNGLDFVFSNVDFYANDNANDNESINGLFIAHNANTFNIDSINGANHLISIHGLGNSTLSTINVTGDAHLHIEDLASIYNNVNGRLATFDASENTGGVNIGFTSSSQARIKFIGTEADDVLTVGPSAGAEKVNVSNAAGSNIYTIVAKDEINIFDGTGDNLYELNVTGSGNDAEITVTAEGDGQNKLELGAGDGAVELVTIDFAGDKNTVEINTKVNDTATITFGGENGMVYVEEAETIVVSAEGGRNTVDISGENLTVEVGGNGNNVLLNGTYPVPNASDDEVENGALLNIVFSGAANNSVTLGHPVEERSSGVTALEGSVISGESLEVIVLEVSDLRAAELEGLSNVVMNDTLYMTVDQFLEIGPEAFDSYRQVFGTNQELHLIVNSDTDLTEVDLSSLREFNYDANGNAFVAAGIQLHFHIAKNANLTLTAEQLHMAVAIDGISVDNVGGELRGSVTITEAGHDFNPFEDDTDYNVGGTLTDVFEGSGNVTIIRSDDGFNRPDVEDSTDTYTITVTAIDQVIDGLETQARTIVIEGEGNLTFTDSLVAENLHTLDFSGLVGNLNDLTIENFDEVYEVIGNNSNTRINVELVGDVGTDEEGLLSSGVETYVVTKLDDNREFWTCETTKDLQTLGLQGNYTFYLTFGRVDHGVNFLMEAAYQKNAGFAVGTMNIEMARPGGEALVMITNLTGDLPAGEVITVAGIGFVNTTSVTVDAVHGDVVVETLNGDIESLTLTTVGDFTVEEPLPSTLTLIDGTAVDGELSLTLTDEAPGEGLTFIGSDVSTTLTMDAYSAGYHSSFSADPDADFVLVIKNDTDLSAATLNNVDLVSLGDKADIGDTNASASVTLSYEQVEAIGAENIVLTHPGLNGALSVLGLAEQAFDSTEVGEGVSVGVTMAEGTWTLNPAIDLSNVDRFEIPADTEVTLTADQVVQLATSLAATGNVGSFVADDSAKVNITGLTQAHVDTVFTLAGVDYTFTEMLSALSGIIDGGMVTLAESIVLDESGSLGGLEFVLGDDMILSLATPAQADGLSVIGGDNTTLNMLFATLDLDSIDASGFDVDFLRVLDILVADQNVDAMFTGLSERVEKVIYNKYVHLVDQTVTVEPGVTVRGGMAFDHTEAERELEDFVLNLQGGTEIQGNINLGVTDKENAQIQTFLKTVTINSEGDAGNVRTGNTDNILIGLLTTNETNQLLDVTINAEQVLSMGGIDFHSMINDDEVALLTVNGSADVAVGILDTSDSKVATLEVVHNGTGVLTATLNGFEDALSVTGTGDVVLLIDGTDAIDLSEAVLDAVVQIEVLEGAEVTLTADQVVALGAANVLGEGTVNIIDLADQPIDTTLMSEDLTINITTAPEEFTLDPDTNLTNVTLFTIADGSVITMTAQQALQLNGEDFRAEVEAGAEVAEINVTGITQDDIDAGLEDVVREFANAGVTAGSLELVEDVVLQSSLLNEITDETNLTLIGTGVRVDVIMDETPVGTDPENGVQSDGVASYIVTEFDNLTAGEFFVSNNTLGLETLGLQLNDGNTITFGGIKRGVNFLLEGDGVADWEELEKETLDVDTASIGALIANFYTPNNPFAVVEINNQGVTLGEASDGGVRSMTVDGITINNTRDVTVNVADGSVAIGSFAGDQAESLTITNPDGDVAVWIAEIGLLAGIDGSGVSGGFTLGVGEFDGSSFAPADFTSVIIDLSDTTLTGVDAIALAQESELTVDIDQYLTVNIVDASGTNDAGTLTVVNLNDEVFDTAGLDGDITIDKVVVAAIPVVTLNPATNLLGVPEIEIPEDTVLNMSGEQLVQLLTGNATISGEGTINLTDFSQTVVDDLAALLEDGAALTIDATVTAGTIDVDGNISLPASLIALEAFTYLIGDNQVLSLENFDLADGFKVSGDPAALIKPLVTFEFNGTEPNQNQPFDETIDVEFYQNVDLRFRDELLNFFEQPLGTDSQAIEELLVSLENASILNITSVPEGDLPDARFRVVNVEPTAMPDGITFSAGVLSGQAVSELRGITLNLQADAQNAAFINGDIVVNDGVTRPNQTLLTINTVDLSGADPLTADPIVIDGEIMTDGALAGNAGDLLRIAINADVDLQILGTITYNSEYDGDTARLTLGGSADIQIKSIDTTDADITAFVVNTDAFSGTLTIPGGSDSLELADTLTLTIVGSDAAAAIVLDTNATTDGIDGGGDLQVINASGYAGTLTLGKVTGIDAENFTFTAGTGETSMTLIDSELNAVAPQPGWVFDFSNAGPDSVFEIGLGNIWTAGSLVIDLGAETTMLISETTDWTGLDLDITQTQDIVLADGVTLTLTAAQANGLNIVPAVDADPSTTSVEIIDLNGMPVDLSGIDPAIAGFVSLAAPEAPAAFAEADVTLHADTILGAFSVALQANATGNETDLSGQTIRFANAVQAERAIVVFDDAIARTGDAGNPVTSTNVIWLFDQIVDTQQAGKVDTSGYDAEIGRVWMLDQLVDGANVEDLFTVLSSDIVIRVANSMDLNLLLPVGLPIDRTIEVESFTELPGGLTFNDIDDVSDPDDPILQFIQNLRIDLGGQVDMGDLIIDNILGAPTANSPDFDTLTINSLTAEQTAPGAPNEFYLLPEDWNPNTNPVPGLVNVIGDIDSGPEREQLANVEINTGSTTPSAGNVLGAALEGGTITFASDDAVEYTDTATLTITGENNVTLKSLDTSDPDITTLVVNTGGHTGIYLLTGGSPAAAVGDTEVLLINPGDAGEVYFGHDLVNGEYELNEYAGVAGAELSVLTVTGTAYVNLGVIALIDGTDDDTTGDGIPDQNAFTLTGNGDTFAVLGQALVNGVPTAPELESGSTWSFNDVNLTITEDVVFQPTSTLVLDDVNLTIDGDVDLTEVDLQIDGGTITVPEGQNLVLTIDQVLSLSAVGLGVTGSGNVKVIGNATAPYVHSSGTHDSSQLGLLLGNSLLTMNVDFSGITIDEAADDIGGFQFIAFGATDDDNQDAEQTIVGSPNNDYLLTVGGEAFTLDGTTGINVYSGGNADHTFIVEDSIGIIENLVGPDPLDDAFRQDAIQVASNGIAYALVTDDFIATIETVNEGIATIIGEGGITIDMSAAEGSNGFTLIGGSGFTYTPDPDDTFFDEALGQAEGDAEGKGRNTAEGTVLIGSNQDDVINGGNDSQTTIDQVDVLTGNGGSDTFVFNIDISAPEAPEIETIQDPIDEEVITVTSGADDNDGDETITITYVLNGFAQAIIIDNAVTPFNADVSNDVAAIIASRLNDVPGISAVATLNEVSVTGDGINSITISSIVTGGSNVGFDITSANGTDQAQITEVTIAPGVVEGEIYSLITTLANGTVIGATYTVQATDDENDVALGLANAFNANPDSVGQIEASTPDNVITLTDLNPDNGGFTVVTDGIGGVVGTGASFLLRDIVGPDPELSDAFADLITDFTTGADSISFGGELAAGSAGNFVGAAAALDFEAALDAADLAFDGGAIYYLTSIVAEAPEVALYGGDIINLGDTIGLLFFDANGDTNPDGVISLLGVDATMFAATDIAG